MINLVNDNLQNEINNQAKPVLVDFYGDWCNPCKMISPIIDEISREYDGKLEVIKVNVDENPVSAAVFGIRSIPTLLVFDKGLLIKKQIGALPKSQIIQLFEKFLG